MSIHVIAKIKRGRVIIGYRLISTKEKLANEQYKIKDVAAADVIKRFEEHKWQREFKVSREYHYDKDSEIYGFYMSKSEGRKPRTPDGVPIIKFIDEIVLDENKMCDMKAVTIQNENSLMEIKPSVFVDYSGKVRQKGEMNRIVDVMTPKQAFQKKKTAGKRNFAKHARDLKKQVNERVGLS